MSPKEFAAWIAAKLGTNTHVETVYQWLKDGMPHYRVGRGRITISGPEALEWMRR